MKTQTLSRSFLVCLLFLPSVCLAQIDWNYRTSTTFKNGFTIADYTEITPKLPKDSDFIVNKKPVTTMYDKPSIDGNTIYRVFKDNVNKIYFGYDFEVKEANESGKFIVSIKPLSSEEVKKSAEKDNFTAQILPKYPDAIEVSEGDTISLVLMENPTTKQKFVDYVKIFKTEESMNSFFAGEKPVRDFTIEDVVIRLTDTEYFANDESILTEKGGSRTGGILAIYLEGKGRFTFSLIPRADGNFQKIGEIVGNRIYFKYAGVDYKIISSAPIVSDGGHWNLWVSCDPNYKPKVRMSDLKPPRQIQ